MAFAVEPHYRCSPLEWLVFDDATCWWARTGTASGKSDREKAEVLDFGCSKV